MSSNNSEGHTASPYDDKPAKGADGTVVNTVSRGDATGSVDGEGFPADIDEKKLMRKVDFRLIPWLCVLYLLSFLDRSAIGNARLYGLEKELNLSSQEYNLALTVFFFPYALFEVPSNILLKRLRPSIWFPLITMLVGVCMLSQGLVRNYHGLVVARFFLGVTEAGTFQIFELLHRALDQDLTFFRLSSSSFFALHCRPIPWSKLYVRHSHPPRRSTCSTR